MRSLILITSFLLLTGCGPQRTLDNLDSEHFRALGEDLQFLYSIKKLEGVKGDVRTLKRIQSINCEYAPENAVRYIIAQEIIFEDTAINKLIKSGDLIVEGGNINAAFQRFNTVKQINSGAIKKLIDSLDKTSISDSVNTKVDKLKLAFSKGYSNIPEQDKVATIEMGATLNCALSSIYLFTINQDENTTVDSTLKSIMRQMLVENMNAQ